MQPVLDPSGNILNWHAWLEGAYNIWTWNSVSKALAFKKIFIFFPLQKAKTDFCIQNFEKITLSTSSCLGVTPDIFLTIFSRIAEFSFAARFSTDSNASLVFVNDFTYSSKKLLKEFLKATEQPPSGVISSSESLLSTLSDTSEGDRYSFPPAGHVACK